MDMTTAVSRAVFMCVLAIWPQQTKATQISEFPLAVPPVVEAVLFSPFLDGAYFGEIVPVRAAIFESARLVRPDIAALAAAPSAVVVPNPTGGGSLRLPVVEFDAREGFTFDADGNVVPSPDPGALSFSIHARSGGNNIHIRIRRGRLHATLNSDRVSFVTDFDAQAGAHVLQVANRELLGRAQCAVGMRGEISEAGGIVKRAHAHSPAGRIPASMFSTSSKSPTFRIGILIAYTPQALTQAGGISSLEMTADASIEQVNRALADSGQAIYLRLERRGLLVATDFVELTSMEQPIPSSRFAYVRNMAQASTQIDGSRVAAGADIVVTLVADEGNPNVIPPDPFYGIAFTQRPNCQTSGSPIACLPGPDYRPFAFAVVSRPFATLNYTFAHEVGHTFGAEHEPRFGVGEGLASFLHSYGHRVSQFAMDIMADPLCITPNPQDPPGTPLICTTKFLQFANPTVPFLGTQVASGTTTPFDPPIDGNRTRDVALTFRKLAAGTASLEGGLEPERVFWDGFE